MQSAHEFAEEIEFWPVDFPPASTVLPLKEALTAADPAWIKSFRDAEGVSGLCGVRISHTGGIVLSFAGLPLSRYSTFLGRREKREDFFRVRP